MGEIHDAEAGAPAETDAERVVRHKFGFAHAAALVCLALLFLPPLTLPRLDTGASDPPRTAHLTPQAAPSYDELLPKDLEESAAPKEESRREKIAPQELPVDPRVDEAFAALDRKNLRQLDAFLAKHHKHAYAIAQGYIVQVDAWRKEAEWAAEDARLKKMQSAVEWDHD